MRKSLKLALTSFFFFLIVATPAVAAGSGAVVASTAAAVAASLSASQMMHLSTNANRPHIRKPVTIELPKGWHFGIAICRYPIEGKYCCIKSNWRGKCESKIPLDEFPKYQNLGKGYEIKPTGIVYDPSRQSVYIYYLWKKKD